jgi:hypothetical protein
MFTSVIGALTSALPKYFVWGAYVPVLIFSFVNTGLAYLLWAPARSWILKGYSSNAALTIATAFVLTVVIAYLVSSVNDFLREFLEGRYLLPPLFRDFLSDRQQQHRTGLQDAYLRVLEKRYEFGQHRDSWEMTLRDAADAGVRDDPGEAPKDLWEQRYEPSRDTDARSPETRRFGESTRTEHGDRPETKPYRQDSKAARRLEALRDATREPLEIPVPNINEAVIAMASELRRRSKLKDARLARDHKELLLVLDTIYTTTLTSEHTATLELNTAYSGDVPAPTRMGNVADAMKAYPMQRYGIDLSVLLSRLQATLLKNDAKDYPIVLDAKTQLDFLVACCCFCGLTTLVWSVLVLAFRGSLGAYALLTVIGPFLTWWLSWVTTQSYIAYSVAVRACVDINRFALLRALELPLPTTLNAELRMWQTVSDSAVSGYTAELSYEHGAK